MGKLQLEHIMHTIANDDQSVYDKLKQLSIDKTENDKISQQHLRQLFEQNNIDINIAHHLFKDDMPFITTQEYKSWLQSFQPHQPKKEKVFVSMFEYAANRCIRPVLNNVFMEKSVEECSSIEMEFEVERLICCLHFLSKELNVYKTLPSYLSEIENKENSNEQGTGYLLLSQPTTRNLKTKHNKSETNEHIKWLHRAYIEDKN